MLLAHTGENYYQGVGVVGNFLSTPNATANNITGDIEITWNYTPQNISLVSDIAVKFNGTQYAYKVAQFGSQRLQFESIYGTSTSTNHGVSSGTNIWFKITRTSSNGHVSFFKSNDNITYTLISTDTTKASGALATGGSLDLFRGDAQVSKYYRLTISNSIGGTPVVDFNPSSYNPSTSQTQWTSATGEVWTINTGTATTGYKGVLVDRTTIMGDYIDDNMSRTISRSSINTTFIAAKGFINDNTGGAIFVRPSSGFSNIVVFGTTGTFVWMNTYASNVNISRVVNVLEMYTITNNSGVNNAISKNNGTENTNTYSPNNMGSGLTLMGANLCLNTYIENSSQSTTIQKTAMYNALKGFNGNSF